MSKKRYLTKWSIDYEPHFDAPDRVLMVRGIDVYRGEPVAKPIRWVQREWTPRPRLDGRWVVHTMDGLRYFILPHGGIWLPSLGRNPLAHSNKMN